MQISELTLRVALLFLPGLISAVLLESLIAHRELKVVRVLVEAFVFGFVCYLAYGLVLRLVSFFYPVEVDVCFFEALADHEVTIAWSEVLFAAVLAVPVGLVAANSVNRKHLHRLGRWLRVTKQFGDLDVWAHVLNLDNTEWVVVRDIRNKLAYEGWIDSYSDTVDKNELFLRDVWVIDNESGEVLYKTPGLYVSRRREDMTIEFPRIEVTEFMEVPAATSEEEVHVEGQEAERGDHQEGRPES